MPGRALRQSLHVVMWWTKANDRNHPHARKGITTWSSSSAASQVSAHRNHPHARKGITTTRAMTRSRHHHEIGIILMPGRALRRPSQAACTRSSVISESSSCPEGHYDAVSRHASVVRIPSSESSSCPEGHYDSASLLEERRLPLHRNHPHARKGITTVRPGNSHADC